MLQGSPARPKHDLLTQQLLLSSETHEESPRSREIGHGIARVLRGSWRSAPPAIDFPLEVLDLVHERLQRTGGGGVAWWRIRGSGLAESSTGAALHDAFRAHTLDVRLQQQRLTTALALLRAHGIEPVLGKGWALARLYPSVGLRPFGDLDLFVPPEDVVAAERLLAGHSEGSLLVDLHGGFPPTPERWAEAFERATPVPLSETEVRVFAPEDHLALLASHLLFHGAWRPLWLCDIAIFVERCGDSVDWERVSALPRRRAEEVAVVVCLAHALLGADIGSTPWADDPRSLPSWLPRGTLAAWSRPHYSTTTRFMLTEARPASLWRSARTRWPNPIEVTHRWGVPYNRLPRLPIQAWDAAVRALRAALAAPRYLSRRKLSRGGPDELG